jgi:spore coat polysaccharide biosynthesis protein SpsF (cytidylyltransferase family)
LAFTARFIEAVNVKGSRRRANFEIAWSDRWGRRMAVAENDVNKRMKTLKAQINDASIAIIQARMGSARFPGKVMHSFAGKPSIEHLLDAVGQVYDPGNVVVATSRAPENGPLAAFCRQRGFPVVRGSETNVASRFWDILNMRKSDYFVRLNADSPLLDHRIIVEAMEIALAEGPDVVSTATERQFPSGMNVEVVKSETFLHAYDGFTESRHFEHVTTYFYEHRDIFSIRAVQSGISGPAQCKFSFDTEDDREKIAVLFGRFGAPHYTYTCSEKCRMYRELFGG